MNTGACDKHEEGKASEFPVIAWVDSGERPDSIRQFMQGLASMGVPFPAPLK